MRKTNLKANYQTLPLDIVGSSSFGRYGKISLAQTWNMMISDSALVPYPGYQKIVDITQGGEGRELYASTKANRMFTVIGNSFCSIDAAFGVQFISQLITSTGNVFMAENNKNQIAIVDETALYIYNYFDGSFNTYTSKDLGFIPKYITFQDGYFIACGPTLVTTGSAPISNQWFLSDLEYPSPGHEQPFPLTPDTVGQLETKPDSTVAVVPLTTSKFLFVFGNTVGEPWRDVGYTLFPYQLNNSYCFDYGCLSPTTIDKGDNFVIWLGANEKSGPVIMYSDGGLPKQISTDGINFQLAELNNPQNSYGFLFKQDGHLFYQISFVDPADNVSFAYDFNTDKFFNISDQNFNYSIIKRVAFFNGAYYFISFNDSSLYQIGSQFTTYNTDIIQSGSSGIIPLTVGNHIIPRVRICNNIRLPDASRFVVNSVNITMEQGESPDIPAIDISMSRDGGATFGNNVRMNLNPLGHRQNKFIFWNGGAANDAILQFRMWSQGRFVLIGGETSIYQ